MAGQGSHVSVTDNELTEEADRIRSELAVFIDRHPGASVEVNRGPNGETRARILRPWSDPSIATALPPDPKNLIEALNNLLLPAQLSAIYHVDTRKLEVIYTALKLIDDFSGREFDFIYENTTHHCSFDNSSQRLIEIATTTRPQSTTQTNFRNLQSFILYASVPEKNRSTFNLNRPLSFWIDNLDWNEERVYELINSLNFHMLYYDFETSLIMVHNLNEDAVVERRSRYLHGSFPTRIEARNLDQNLISFWNATHRANELLSFILFYRIIEYAQFHYVENITRREMSRIIRSPHFTADLTKGVERLAEIVQTKGLEEIQKFRMTIKNNCDAGLIWCEIERCRSFFEQEIQFDGGFNVKALITKKDDEENFRHSGMERFIDSIRKIRNTLSHGKDQETAGVITPTLKNFELLRPWVNLISIVAGEVVLYKDVT